MSVTHKISVRNALCDHVVDQIDAGTAGKLIFRKTGSTADSPTAVPVATLTFSAVAFDSAGSAGGNADGVAEADTITSDTNAAGGDMAYATLEDSAANVVAHCSVGIAASGEDIIMSSLTVAPTDTVSVSQLSYEAPN